MQRGPICLSVGAQLWQRCRAARQLLRPHEVVPEAAAVWRHAHERDHGTLVQAVACWLRGRIRYVGEPVGKDWWCSPGRTLQRGWGDCEDFSLVAVSILMRLGVDAGLVYGLSPSGQGHAWVVGVDPRGGEFQWEPQSMAICWGCTLAGYDPHYVVSQFYCGRWVG